MPDAPLRVAYLGNFEPEHSTENHVARAWRNNGHHVQQFQEGNTERLVDLINLLRSPLPPDLVMWTRTASLAAQVSEDLQREMLFAALAAGVPTVGYHLDRWWGLDRQHQIGESPWFQCELVVTADGGHDWEWADAGVNHLWMPPGVSLDEALREPSERAGRFSRYKVAFVGSYRSYHLEWLEYRRTLVNNLSDWYGSEVLLVEGGLRGQGLVDLYRTVPVIIGDSCLAPAADGTPMTRYWSDRIPETLGRGGLLIHPEVGGLREAYTALMEGDANPCYWGPLTYPLGDWNELRGTIGNEIGNLPDRWPAGDGPLRSNVLMHHTYERRMEQLVGELQARSMLPTVNA